MFKLPKPPAPEEDELLEDRILTPEEQLLAWRFIGLLDLSFSPEQAELLTPRADVVHDAKALLARGMPHDLVLNELT